MFPLEIGADVSKQLQARIPHTTLRSLEGGEKKYIKLNSDKIALRESKHSRPGFVWSFIRPRDFPSSSLPIEPHTSVLEQRG
jgi:hypothetical protein